MSDVDLVKVDKADNKFGKYVTLLQVKYGYTRDQAKKEVSRRMLDFEAESASSVPPVWFGWQSFSRDTMTICILDTTNLKQGQRCTSINSSLVK